MRVGRLLQILSLFKQRNHRANRQRANRLVETLESRTLLSSPGMVADINPGPGSSSPAEIVALGNTVYLAATDADHGMELWKSDGTAAGTVLVKDINPGPAGASISGLVAYHGEIYFAADDGEHGIELWKSDGTAAGTTMVADVYPGASSASPQNLTVANDTLFFSATTSQLSNSAVYRSDGTSAGTSLVMDFAFGRTEWGPWTSSPSEFTPCGGKLFFTAAAYTPAGDIDGTDLFVTDGTSAGTRNLDINHWGTSEPSRLTDFNGTLYLTATGGNYNVELWKVDPVTLAATQFDLNNDPWRSSEPADLTAIDNALYVTAKTNIASGRELWRFVEGQDPERVVAGPTCVPSSGTLAAVEGSLFFAGADASGVELWKTDGTTAGTVRVADIAAGAASSTPANLVDVGGWLLFTADDGINGRELWLSHGTSETTQQIADLNPGPSSSSPEPLAYISGTVFFTADDGVHGDELWKLSYGSIGLECSAISAKVGEPLTLAARIDPAAVAASPDSPIVFRDGSAVLGSSVPDAAGQATFTTSSLSAGAHRITASWDGDPNSPRLVSAELDLSVRKLATSIALTATPNSIVFGAYTTFTAVVSGETGIPNGAVTFMDGDRMIDWGVIGPDGRTSVTAYLSAGVHEVKAVYFVGLANNIWSDSTSAPLEYRVDRATTSISLETSPNPVVFGTRVQLTALVTSNGAAPQGGVFFTCDGMVIAAPPVFSDGRAVWYADLPVGTHTLTASFHGGPGYADSESNPILQEVRQYTTVTTLGTSATNLAYGVPVTLTAAVASQSAPALAPEGIVRFIDLDANLVLGERRLDAGVATLILEKSAVGAHRVIASFVADDSTFAASQSPQISFNVSSQRTTATITSERSSTFGGLYVLAARVSCPGGIFPDGSVLFTDRRTILGTAILENGVAKLPLSGLARGSHIFTATYSGNANFNASVSRPAIHSVRLTSSVRLSVSAAYATAGQPLTLSAAISPRASRRLAPSGKILFYSDGVLLGRGRISKNTSQLITRKLSPGPHTITASYTGDASFIPSDSVPVDAVITYPTVVDLLVLYTPAALASIGGPAAMNDTIRQAVRDTNQSFINSRIPVTVRVVSARQVQYTESGDYDTDLVRLRWRGDGYLDEVPALRNKYGADLVSLFAAPSNDDTLGIGYQLLNTAVPGNDAQGYSVVAAKYAAAPDYVLAHELGHNLGASHDVEQDDSDGATADSHGYRFMAHGILYHDIMSYDPGIVIPYFSNPLVNYLGIPTGTVSSANSARVITAASSYVAAYRPTKLSLKSTLLLLN